LEESNVVTDDDRISYLIGDEPVGDLGPEERAGLDDLLGSLADPAVWAEPSPDLEDRIVAAISAAGAAGPAAGTGIADPTARAAAAGPAAGTGIADPTARAAAAGPAAGPGIADPTAGAAGPAAGTGIADPTAAAAAPAALDAEAPEAAATPQVVPFRRRRAVLAVVGLAAAVAAVFGLAFGLSGGTHRLTYHAALAGTSLAPAASGQVTMVQTVSGWQITLHAKGLPRLDNGQFYQAWLKNKAGILVPIGTFNQPTDVILWSGVSPYQFPVITVTRQKADGNLNSSGQRVLTGTAHES
jgi:hypothetical protein